jgi:hypothetical protein
MVAVLVGDDWSTATQQAITSVGSDVWTANVRYSNPLPQGETILVRLTMPDGDIVESSLNDITPSRL